jgi:hypothetical protein
MRTPTQIDADLARAEQIKKTTSLRNIYRAELRKALQAEGTTVEEFRARQEEELTPLYEAAWAKFLADNPQAQGDEEEAYAEIWSAKLNDFARYLYRIKGQQEVAS